MGWATDQLVADNADTVSDAVLNALADAERRRVLSYLLESRNAESADDLATCVESITARARTSGPSRTVVRLHHLHLPKLEEAGLVEYDPLTRMVRLTDAGKSIESSPEPSDG